MLVAIYNCNLKLPLHYNSVFPYQCDIMKYLSIDSLQLDSQIKEDKMFDGGQKIEKFTGKIFLIKE